MKKFIISLILLVPFISGCANIDTRLTLNNDKSATVVTSLTYQGNISDGADANATAIDSNYQKFLDPLYITQNVYGKKLSTITATKKVGNIELSDIDLSSLGLKSNLPGGKFIDVKKNFLVTSYNIDADFDYPEQQAKIKKEKTSVNTQSSSGLDPVYLREYGDVENSDEFSDSFLENLDDDTREFIKDSIDNASSPDNKNVLTDINSTFSIKVPSFASYNNADNVEGDIYTWNIKKDGITNIKFQYVKYNSVSILIILILGIALLALLARRIVKRDSQKQLDAQK